MEVSKTADQALLVLLALEDGPLTASQLSTSTHLNRTVVHRMLATLDARGFVRREGDRYSYGSVLARFAAHAEPALRTAARPVIEQLAVATRETVTLTMRDRADAVGLDQVVGTSNPLRVEFELGMRRPLAQGASGRAILANLPDRVAEEFVRSSDDPDLLAEQLIEIRRTGVGLSHDELHHGIFGIAAPIFDTDGVVGALAITVPAQRSNSLQGLKQSILQAASSISASLRLTS